MLDLDEDKQINKAITLYYIKISKFLQCHCHPEALQRHLEIPVPSVNNHPIIADVSRKFHENGPCVHTISFRVTMDLHSLLQVPSLTGLLFYLLPEKLCTTPAQLHNFIQLSLHTTPQLHSTKPELRFCAGSNTACGVSEIRDGENL